MNAPVLYLASVPRRRAENSAFHLPAHHVTSPDTSRGETQHARLKSVQSQNAPSLFSCAKSLRRRISSQIGWLTQNSERAVSQLIRAMMRARASGCTVAYLAQGACRAPKTGGARLTEALKAETCSSTFAHAHKGRGMRCSSTPKSAGPAGRRALREARAAPDRASAGLLDSLPAPASTGIVV